MKRTAPELPVFLGCPVWGCCDWSGQVYPERTPRNQWLSWYSQMFNTVEGNSTFYGLPPVEIFRRWAEESAKGFRFSFKFPRLISHELELQHADAETASFLRCLEPLAKANRLGPTFLQLGPAFGPDRFEVLRGYLQRLPRDHRWAVEVRNHDWFDRDGHESKLNELLAKLKIDKVLFDSRPLFHLPPEDDSEAASQKRKPKTPVRQTVTGRHPMLRIVGRNRVGSVDHFLDQWSPIVAGWIADGRRPFLFTHTPDDAFAPQLARRFADRLAQVLPQEQWQLPTPPAAPRQLSLLEGGR